MQPIRLLLEHAVDRGDLTVIDARGRRHRVSRGIRPRAVVRLVDKAAERRLLLRPELALGELYVDERLVIEEGTLEDLLAIVMGARRPSRSLAARLLPGFAHLTLGWLRACNPLRRAARNASHHYDLGNAFYRAWLDPAMQYSCAYFAAPGDDLATAQQRKMRHIAAKLRLRPGLRVLDIGCGWGGLARHIAREHGCHVTGLTLAHEQAAFARERVADEGLEDRVEIRLEDYRKTSGPFDRIVSVGMFEHVGPAHYGTFFDRVADLLAPDGIALVHSIGRAHGPSPTNPWLARYIFPGGYIPALSEVLPAVERASLWATDVEVLRLHYAETLAAWRRAFTAAAGVANARLRRLWNFYLLGSEYFFRQQDGMVFQIQLARDHAAVPLTRDYLYPARSTARAPDAAEPDMPLAV